MKTTETQSRHSVQRLVMPRPKNPKRLDEACRLLRSLRDWTQIEGGLERENKRAADVWREVNGWARGAAMKMNIDLNQSPLPAQPPNDLLETEGRAKPEGFAAAPVVA